MAEQWWAGSPVVMPAEDAARWWEYSPIVVPAPREYEKEIQARKKRLDEIAPYNFTDNLVGQGILFGAGDELAGVAGAVAGLLSGEGISKPYAVARDAERDRQKEYARRHSGRAMVSGLLGGVVTGGTAAKAGLTAYKAGMSTLPQLMKAGAIDAAAMGAAGGFLTGEGVEGRLWEAGKGAAVGAGLGAAVPPVVAGGKAVIGALGGNALVGALDPKSYARALLVRTMQNAKATPQSLKKGIRSSELDAQGDVWTLADELGYSGRRRLTGATQSPSQAQAEAQDFLKRRQAGQGERIGAALEESMGTARTAQEARTELVDQRADTARTLWGEARDQAEPVDLSTVIARLDQELSVSPDQVVLAARKGKGQNTKAAQAARIDETKLPADSIARSLARVRNSLTDAKSGATLSDWGLIYRARQDLADLIDRVGLKPAGQGGGYNNQGRILADIRGQVDEALEAASEPYRRAADRYRQDSRTIEAVELGEKAAAGAGKYAREADNIRLYKGLSDAEKAAFRAGYVNQLLARVERAPGIKNQAENFTSMKTQAELKAFTAPGKGERLSRSLAREGTMHDTRREAFLGSQTSRNQADEDDVSNQLSVIANLLRANWTGAGQSALTWARSFGGGYTPAVREELIRMLMQTPGKKGGKAGFDRLMKSLTEQQARDLQKETMRALLLRGGYGGVATQ